jgi:hypothetical protein
LVKNTLGLLGASLWVTKIGPILVIVNLVMTSKIRLLYLVTIKRISVVTWYDDQIFQLSNLVVIENFWSLYLVATKNILVAIMFCGDQKFLVATKG